MLASLRSTINCSGKKLEIDATFLGASCFALYAFQAMHFTPDVVRSMPSSCTVVSPAYNLQDSLVVFACLDVRTGTRLIA
jgi:hypothetical protein